MEKVRKKSGKTDWSRVIAVTNRALCAGDFLLQVEKAAALGVQAVILREKDLSPEDYDKLAVPTMEICKKYHVDCILHTFVDIAKQRNCPNIHLPLTELLRLQGITFDDSPELIAEKRRHADVLSGFEKIGASVHSPEDALLAERAGCTYMTAGHVFVTDCKKNLPPRGIDFLENICNTVSVPVYGIGGIHPDNMHLVMETGASGVCMMSEFMR